MINSVLVNRNTPKPKIIHTHSMKKSILILALSVNGIAASNAQSLSATSTCPGSNLTVSGVSSPSQIIWQRDGVNIYTVSPTLSVYGTTVAGDGTVGNTPAQLSSPQGVCAGRNGAIYVADYGNSRVQKWAPGATAGITVAGTGTYGSNADQLSYPTGLCVDRNDNVYVIDANNNRVQKWTPGATAGITVAGDGTAGSGPGQLYQPFGICVDTSGNVYVADAGNNRVQKWAQGATSGTTVAGNGIAGSGQNQLFYPQGICLDASGNLYVADNFNNRIQKWIPGSGNGVTVVAYVDHPSAVYADGSGNLYVDDQDVNGIRQWAPGATSGTLVAGIGGYGSGPDQLASPSSVCLDSAGQIYVSDNINNRIQKYSAAVVTTLTATTGGNYDAIVTEAGINTVTNTVTINAATTAGTIIGAANVAVGSATILTDIVAGGTWSASNDKVIVADGMVTGVTNGGTTISYTTDGVCGTATAIKVITVGSTPFVVTPITGYFFYLCEGATAQFFDGTTGGTWSINPADAAMASVSGTGNITGISAGTVRLTYTLGASFATAVVTVYPTPAAITGAANVCQGLTTQLYEATTGGVWSSAIPSAAAVGATGLVTAGYPTNVPIYYTITATGCRATVTITINANPSAVTGPSKVCTGLMINLSDATAGGSWSASNTHATVDASGSVAGVTAGSTAITYQTAQGCSKVLNVTVNQTPASISGNLKICTGAKTFLSDVTTGGISWTSSNTGVATISASGVGTGIAAGTTIVSYTTSNNCASTAILSVNPTPSVSPISGVSSVANGGAGITLSDAAGNGIWTSSNPAILTVGSSSGLVTAHVSSGSAYISYTITNSYACSSYATKSISCLPPATGRVSNSTTNDSTMNPENVTNAEWILIDDSIDNTDGSGSATTAEDNSFPAANTASSVIALPISISLQPNPNNGNFRIKSSDVLADGTTLVIEVTDMAGHLVYTDRTTAHGGSIDQQVTLDGALANGVYLLNVKTGALNNTLSFVIRK